MATDSEVQKALRPIIEVIPREDIIAVIRSNPFILKPTGITQGELDDYRSNDPNTQRRIQAEKGAERESNGRMRDIRTENIDIIIDKITGSPGYRLDEPMIGQASITSESHTAAEHPHLLYNGADLYIIYIKDLIEALTRAGMLEEYHKEVKKFAREAYERGNRRFEADIEDTIKWGEDPVGQQLGHLRMLIREQTHYALADILQGNDNIKHGYSSAERKVSSYSEPAILLSVEELGFNPKNITAIGVTHDGYIQGAHRISKT